MASSENISYPGYSYYYDNPVSTKEKRKSVVQVINVFKSDKERDGFSSCDCYNVEGFLYFTATLIPCHEGWNNVICLEYEGDEKGEYTSYYCKINDLHYHILKGGWKPIEKLPFIDCFYNFINDKVKEQTTV